jgi:hypothetical protein
MRRIVAAALVVLLAGVPAQAGMADRVGATFALIADDFIQAFNPVEAMVVAIENDDIFLDVGSGRGGQVGQEYTIFRKGAVFNHPVTGRALGRYEEVLGYAQVRRVEPDFSAATFVALPEKPRPLPEDGARITRGRLKVAVTPVVDMTEAGADLRRVPYLIATVLERSKRFQVVDPLAVSDMFAAGSVRVEEVLARPERAVRVAKNLEVDRPGPAEPAGHGGPRHHLHLCDHGRPAVLPAHLGGAQQRARGAAIPLGAANGGLSRCAMLLGA